MDASTTTLAPHAINPLRLVFVKGTPCYITEGIPPYSPGKWLADNPATWGSRALRGHFFVRATPSNLRQILTLPRGKREQRLKSLTLVTADSAALQAALSQQFPVVPAAGGLVAKGNDLLMIYRSRHWEFPKGKLEVGEQLQAAAAREVAEECGVQASAQSSVCTTWYTFLDRRKVLLKQITWFRMECLDDSAMQPQQEEGIRRVEWLPLQRVLHGDYPVSFFKKYMQYVLHRYLQRDSSGASSYLYPSGMKSGT